MNDPTNRRLIILFILSLFLSVGAISIGILGIMDLAQSDALSSIRTWMSPIVSIQSDDFSSDQDTLNGPSAMDLEATRLAEEQAQITQEMGDWEVVFSENFESNEADWPEFSEEDSLAAITVGIEQGKYRWVAQAHDGFVWWSYPDMDRYSDFYAEVEAIQTSGDPYGEVGLVFRLDEDDFYLYELSGEFFSLWRSIPDGWETLIEWTESDAILIGEVNLMGVMTTGDQIRLFINNRLVMELEDPHYEAGVVGVAIGLDDADLDGVFEFDNLVIRAP